MVRSNYFPGHKQVCPAQGKSCRSCGKLKHFAKVCRSSSMRKPEFRAQNREKSNEIDNCQEKPEPEVRRMMTATNTASP